MTRIDKFHALPIGQQLNTVAKIINTANNCKYCAFNNGSCPYDKGLELCVEGRVIWWLKDYEKTDF